MIELHFILEKDNTDIAYKQSSAVPALNDIIEICPDYEEDKTKLQLYRVVNRKWLFNRAGTGVTLFCIKN